MIREEKTYRQVTGYTDTPTDDSPTCVHDTETGLFAGNDLDYCSDIENHGSDEKAPSPTEEEPERVSRQGAEETASLCSKRYGVSIVKLARPI